MNPRGGPIARTRGVASAVPHSCGATATLSLSCVASPVPDCRICVNISVLVRSVPGGALATARSGMNAAYAILPTDGAVEHCPNQGECLKSSYAVICFSHLRWSFVFQRPQHLLSRCARERPVYFVEEPHWVEGSSHLDVSLSEEGVRVVVPHVDKHSRAPEAEQAKMIQELIAREELQDYVLWLYTPMALPLTEGLSPRAIVYDCMDQLSAFKGAPPGLVQLERELFQTADVVFTGGQALFDAKKALHDNVHAFPSSVDVPHFAQARAPQNDPDDQRVLSRPRLGFFGVIDERMDLQLVAGVAAARPGWNLVMVGPVVKIDEQSLPRAANITYLGSKSYQELPRYVAGWDVALLPFVRNESTEFISPTKTPEYLAAGLPVVSTSIRDVVRPYQSLGLVRIADSVDGFVAACEAALAEPPGPRLARADEYLSTLSWDRTWADMQSQIEQVVQGSASTSASSQAARSSVIRSSEVAAGAGE